MEPPEKSLPDELLRRASVRGYEYAWRIADIPEVIEATKLAGMISIGGQLQFRLPNGPTCECYWVEVDTLRTISADLSKNELIAQSASVALSDFNMLKNNYDFVAEGRSSFGKFFQECEVEGGDPKDAMWFVWYVKA
jgi:hypothetical protein